MQRIDLIPADLKTYPFLDKRKIFGTTILFTFLAILAIHVFQLSTISRYRLLVEKQKTEKNSLLIKEHEFEEVLSQSEVIRNKEQRLKEKMGIIQEVISDRFLWSPILKEVTQLVPRGSWLKRLKVVDQIAEKEKDRTQVKKRIVFEGFSLENERAFEFLTNLERSPYFESLVLVFSQKDKIGERTIYRFEIEGEAMR